MEAELLDKRQENNVEGNQNERTVCIQNLLKFLNQKQTEKEISKVTSEVEAVYKPQSKPYCFVTFKTTEARDAFIELAPSIRIKNKTIKVKSSKSNQDVFTRQKQQSMKEAKMNEKKRNKEVKIYTDIREKIIPYYQIDYNEQLTIKQDACKEIFKSIAKGVMDTVNLDFPLRRTWLNSYEDLTKDKNEDFFKLLETIKYVENWRDSPRNKIECTFGNKEGRVVIGFVLNNVNSNLEISNDLDMPTIDEGMRKMIKITEDFSNGLKSPSDDTLSLKAFDFSTKSGFFRNLAIRKSMSKNELVLKLVVNTSKDTEEYHHLVNNIKSWYSPKMLPDHEIVGFVIETYEGISNSIPNDKNSQEIVMGDRNYVYDSFMEKLFKIPIDGFFQVHLKPAETLFKEIEKILNIDENTVLLDICAGTGSFGITLGEKAKEVVFIEMESSACDMIKSNIYLNWDIKQDGNGVPNDAANTQASHELIEVNDRVLRIYNDKIENCIEEIHTLYSSKALRIIALVDPPRAGLHPSVAKTLRTFKGVDELVFVSCDFKQAKQNIISLCAEETKRVRGPPFSPLKVIPFDIFPLTPHYETVVHLKRLYE